MARAAELAARGWPAPNPRVGCVLVSDGRIVGQGHHDRKGGPHAEIVALGEAGTQARGATAYVTLEPCDHQGLTPPCSSALLEAGVREVVYADPDPNPTAQGGAERLRAAGVVVRHEPSLEASAINSAFLSAHRRRRAYAIAKAALTADGFMARPDGTSRWITGERARTAGHGLRAEAGAVLIGAETAVLDRPLLTVRAFETGWQPRRYVIDPHRRVPVDSPLFDGAPAVRIVSEANATAGEIGVPNLGSGLDLGALLTELLAKGTTAVLIEGGPRTIRAFAEQGLIDRFDLFSSGNRFGQGRSLEPPTGLVLQSVRSLGEDVWATYSRLGVCVGVPEWERSLRG